MKSPNNVVILIFLIFVSSFNCISCGRDRLAGGIEPLADDKLEELTDHTKKALAQVAAGENETCDLHKIENAGTQVVSGQMYHADVTFKCGDLVETCKLKVWLQRWLKRETYTWVCPKSKVEKYNTEEEKKPSEQTERDARSVPGGVSVVRSVDTLSTVKDYTKQALTTVAAGEKQPCKLEDIGDVTEQTVAGYVYTTKVKYNCGKEVEECELEIFTQLWSGLLEFTWKCPKLDKYSSNYVAQTRRKRALLGGHKNIDASEMRDLEEIAGDAISTVNERNSNKNYHYRGIKSATKQIVSGYSYHVEVNTIDDDGFDIPCSMRIHVQKWKKSVRDIKVTCEGENYRFHLNPHHHHGHSHESSSSSSSHVSKGEEHMLRLFGKFQTRHGRVYHTQDEHQRRFTIFKQNLYKIEQLNRNEEGTAKYGITEFADMTSQEFKRYTGLIMPTEHRENELKNPMADILNIESLPTSFDWREKNVVSEVKNQGSCGSCWAFSVVGNIEGQHAIKYGSLEEYSEQELVDCDKTDNGCGGGMMDDAYKAIETIGGLETEQDYNYEARNDKCRFDSNKVHVRVKGAVDLPKNETAIAQFLVQNGPISVGLNANAMQFYRGGVSKPMKFLCSPKNLDHGVLMVGYGVAEYPKFNKTLPYWIIKNSWGKRWGEQGYYRLYRGDNRCGIANYATSAVIE